MTRPDTVLADLEAGVLTLTLNRPDKLNSFNEAMHRAAARRLRARRRRRGGARGAADRRRPRLLRRAGPRRPRSAQGRPARRTSGTRSRRFYNPTLRLIRALEKPVVCAVNGVAAGAGANIAFACDIVLAARSATFIQAFSKIGLVPDAGGSWSLARILGEPRAKALALLAEPLDAETAAAWGLIWKAVDDDALLDEARGDRRAARRRPDPRARADQAGDPGGGGATASTPSSTSSATCSARPGAPPTTPRASIAFLEKRKPEFTGR